MCVEVLGAPVLYGWQRSHCHVEQKRERDCIQLRQRVRENESETGKHFRDDVGNYCFEFYSTQSISVAGTSLFQLICFNGQLFASSFCLPACLQAAKRSQITQQYVLVQRRDIRDWRLKNGCYSNSLLSVKENENDRQRATSRLSLEQCSWAGALLFFWLALTCSMHYIALAALFLSLFSPSLVCTRICLQVKRAEQSRKETASGHWMPFPQTSVLMVRIRIRKLLASCLTLTPRTFIRTSILSPCCLVAQCTVQCLLDATALSHCL